MYISLRRWNARATALLDDGDFLRRMEMGFFARDVIYGCAGINYEEKMPFMAFLESETEIIDILPEKSNRVGKKKICSQDYYGAVVEEYYGFSGSTCHFLLL